MLEELAPTGVIGTIHLGTNILVPKPYTGWQRVAVARPELLEEKIALLKRGAAALPNVTLSSMSIRQAIWQTYISRAGSDAAELLERAAGGATIASILRRFPERIHPAVFEPLDGRLRWHFMRAGRIESAAAAAVPAGVG